MSTSRKPKQKSVPTSRSSPSFKGFANISLTESAKEDILNEWETEGVFQRHLDGLLSNGYKVSFSPPDDNDCYQVSATGTALTGASEGYATSARSEDLTRAMLALSAKVLVIADGDISTFAVERRSLSEI